MTTRFKMLSGAAFGALLLTVAAAALAPQARAQGFDAAALPRVNVAKEIFVNPATAIYLTGGSVPAAADAVEAALAGHGWQRYEPAFSQPADDPAMRQLFLKKGAHLLSVSVRLAPAQGNATAVQYSELPLANDLPFPPGAAEIRFDPGKPYLSATTTASLAGTLAFFTDALRRLGFEPWPENRPGTEREVAAFFLRQSRQPLLVTLQRGDDRTRIKVEGVSPKLLSVVAQRTQNETARPAIQQPAAPEPRPPAAKSEIDTMIENTMRDALQTAREAGKPPRPAAQPAAPAESLRAMAGGGVPIPVPDTAAAVEHDGADGSLAFTSPSSVASIAAFYRAGMKPLGFSERPSVINRDNMAVLTFAKQGRTVTLTVMRMGSETSVRASGSALVAAAASSAAAGREAPAAQAGAAPQELEAGEIGGLPVPARSTQKGTERTPFRLVLNARVPADAASVLAFYRREFGKRAWKEERAAVGAEDTTLSYAAPEGPAVLVLSRKAGETVVKLSLRKPAEAEKAGLLPKAGQARLVLGNVLEAETTVTIDQRTIKVGPQVGARKPDGPMLDLAPGTYTFSFKSAGQPPRTDAVTVASGETWGILIGPGGALPLQAY